MLLLGIFRPLRRLLLRPMEIGATLSVPAEMKRGQPIPITGYAQVGISGLSKVQVWIHPNSAAWPAEASHFTKAAWMDARILPPPQYWGGNLPDGRTVAASGAEDNACILWDPFANKKLGFFAGHTGPVLAIAFTPDGRQLLTGSTDRTVRLWDVATKKEVRRLEGHAGYVRSVRFASDGRHVLTGSYHHTVRWWDLRTGECRDSFELHDKPVLSVGLSNDGRRAVSGGADGIVCLWELPQ